MIRQLCFLCLLTFAIVANGQSPQDEPYEFPIQPGTEAWKKFTSGQEKKDACQVPAGTLSVMTTQALVKTCLSYPLIGHITAYNDLQTGTESVMAEFNGFQELLKRPDAGVEMMKIYQSMYPSHLKTTWSSLKKGQFAFEFLTVEMLLAQPSVFGKLSGTQKKELVAQSLSKFKEKDTQVAVFGGTGLTTTALVMGRILNSESFQKQVSSTSTFRVANPGEYDVSDETMNSFLSQAVVTDTKVIDNVVVRAQMYLNQ